MYKDILAKMSVEEKAQMITGDNIWTKKFPQHGIDKTIEVSDGPVGVRTINENAPEVEGGNVRIPCISALAATWDRDQVKRAAKILALNCLYVGVSMLLAPAVNIVRGPLCGRNYEYFSEDPYLAGELGAVYVDGLQENGVGTCVKHFACNQQENHRRVVNVEVAERALREIYLAVFEKIVKQSNPTSMMSAYNKINGHYCSENKKLLKDILRSEWGFDGGVISDWGAVHNIGLSIKGGNDLIEPPEEDIVNLVAKALDDGTMTMEDLDSAVSNVLRMVDRVNDLPKTDEVIDRQKAHEEVTDIARDAITLLKNENNILPIKKGQYKKIGVVGKFAENPMVAGGSGGMGGGSADVSGGTSSIDSPLHWIKKFAGDTEIVYKPLYDFMTGNLSFDPLLDIQEVARECEMIIMFAGTHPYWEVEGEDRDSLQLPVHMIRLIEECSRFCPNTVIITQTGAAYAPFMRLVQPKAHIQMWFAGEGGGRAIAETLFGLNNPNGKLPVTFMKEINPDVTFCADGRYMDYKDGLFVGYRYYDQHPEKVWYPFGFGLSYTTFEYSDIKITTKDNMSASVSFKITNTGDMAGKESCQIYVAPMESSVLRPEKELKEFAKVTLNPGETKEVSLELDTRAFSYYNTNINDWFAESGKYEILVGASSQDIRLKGEIEIINPNQYTINREKWTNAGENVIMA